MANHSSTLAWKIPWMEEPGRLPTIHEVANSRTQLSDFTLSFYSSFRRRKCQPTPVFLPGESHEWRGLVGYSLQDCKASQTTKQLTRTHTHTHNDIRLKVKLQVYTSLGLPRWFSGKESACNAGDAVSILGSGRSPGEGNGNPLRYSCLGNPMNRGAWWDTAHGVTKELDMT